MKPVFSTLFLAIALIGLSGCLPVSKNPLSSPEDAVADTRLEGVWYGKSGEDTIFLHFVKGKENGIMDVVEVDHQNNGAHTLSYTMFPSILGETRYMNVREKAGEGKPYYLARYSISKTGTMTIWFMSEKPTAKAVKSDKLEGKVSVQNTGASNESRDITITSDTKSLAAFVGKSDPEILFAEKFGTFKKLTLPSADAPVSASPSPTPKKTTPSKTKGKNR